MVCDNLLINIIPMSNPLNYMQHIYDAHDKSDANDDSLYHHWWRAGYTRAMSDVRKWYDAES